jgi:hypothetical protein
LLSIVAARHVTGRSFGMTQKPLATPAEKCVWFCGARGYCARLARS